MSTLKDAIASAFSTQDAVGPANALVADLTAQRNAAVADANAKGDAATNANKFLSSVLPDDGKIRTTPKAGVFVVLVDGQAKFFEDGGDGSDVTVPDAPGTTPPVPAPVEPPTENPPEAAVTA